MARPKNMEARKMVSLPPALAEQVEGHRFKNRFQTKAEAIRCLLELGLDAACGKPARRPAPSQTS